MNSEIGHWSLVGHSTFACWFSAYRAALSKVNRFSCGIGKLTVDDGSLADSSFTAEASSCGMLCGHILDEIVS